VLTPYVDAFKTLKYKIFSKWDELIKEAEP